MKVIYVAGPYTAPTPEGIAANVARASAVGQECLRRGWAVICPHSMTHNWDLGTGLEPDDFYRTDMELLERCDAVVLVEGWQRSKGTVAELAMAEVCGLAVYADLGDVPHLSVRV